MAELRGIDVSHHNLLNAVQALVESNRLDFLIAKATEGKSFQDEQFDAYMALAYNKGLLRGAYHYVNPKGNLSNPYLEALNFVSQIRPYGDAIPILDFEESDLLNNDGINYLTKVAYYVKQMTCTPPIIYLSESVLLTNNFAEIADMGCGVWVAKWGKNTPVKFFDYPLKNEWNYNKAQSGDFSVVAIQQIASKAIVAGHQIGLDVDVAFMSNEAWLRYANPRLFAK